MSDAMRQPLTESRLHYFGRIAAECRQLGEANTINDPDYGKCYTTLGVQFRQAANAIEELLEDRPAPLTGWRDIASAPSVIEGLKAARDEINSYAKLTANNEDIYQRLFGHMRAIEEAIDLLSCSTKPISAGSMPNDSPLLSAERDEVIERCAKIADEFDNSHNDGHPGAVAAVARAIRSLKSPPTGKG